MNLVKKYLSELKKDKKRGLLIVAFILYTMVSFEFFNRPWLGPVRNLKIPLDDKIPFIKELIIIYHLFTPMLFVVGMILFTSNKKEYVKYLAAMFLAQTSAYLIFIIFQTYVPRYDVSFLGDDIFSRIVRLTYSIDNHYSGAPSLHVCNMFLASFYLKKSNYKYKWPAIAFMMLIAFTTVLVKQHVFLDIPTGIVHAIICYNIVEYYFTRKEGRIYE